MIDTSPTPPPPEKPPEVAEVLAYRLSPQPAKHRATGTVCGSVLFTENTHYVWGGKKREKK